MQDESFKQISGLVQSRLPEFVRVDHPTLVAFLEAYYEWLQSKDRSGKIMSPMVLQDVIDIDRSMEDFISQFKKEYLLGFPEQLAISNDTGKPVDVRKLMKNIKSFYRAKGTEKSYEFLFRILYDTAVEFYYPKKDILRVSDGKWYERTSIKVSNALSDRIFESVGRVVYQRNPVDGKITSSGKVVDASIYQQGPYEVAELILTGRNGTFTPGSLGIQFDTDTETLRELRVYSVIGSVSISNSGSGYSIGDKVVFTTAAGDTGSGATGIVSLVTSSGAIRKIRIENFGINYQAAPTVTIQSLGGGTGFSGTANISSICAAEGYYINSDGLASSRKVIQDNHYFQDYSYVLKTEVVIDEYRDILRRLVHPAGLAMFGQVLIKRCSREDIDNSSALIRYEVPIIGHYAPYTFNTFDNLQDWFSVPATGGKGGQEPAGYNPTYHDPLIKAGVFPTLPIQDTLIGNPISNSIFFTPTSVTGSPPLPPLGTSGAYKGDPFWIIYEHPNRKIKGPTIAQIWRDQLSDFVKWDEHCSVTGGEVTGWTADFYDSSLGTQIEKKYAFLKYTPDSAFRKITTRAFFEIPIGTEFDCRTEDRGLYARPLVAISSPLNGGIVTDQISNGQALIAKWGISNYSPQNLASIGAYRLRLRMDNQIIYIPMSPQGTNRYFNLQSGTHRFTVDIVDEFDVSVGVSDSVVFQTTDTGNDIIDVEDRRTPLLNEEETPWWNPTDYPGIIPWDKTPIEGYKPCFWWKPGYSPNQSAPIPDWDPLMPRPTLQVPTTDPISAGACPLFMHVGCFVCLKCRRNPEAEGCPGGKEFVDVWCENCTLIFRHEGFWWFYSNGVWYFLANWWGGSAPKPPASLDPFTPPFIDDRYLIPYVPGLGVPVDCRLFPDVPIVYYPSPYPAEGPEKEPPNFPGYIPSDWIIDEGASPFVHPSTVEGKGVWYDVNSDCFELLGLSGSTGASGNQIFDEPLIPIPIRTSPTP